jgi:hypothetical protein
LEICSGLTESFSTLKRCVGNMFDSKRRTFLQQTAIGLASVGISGLVLRSDAQPTQGVSRDQTTSDQTALKTDCVLIQMGPSPKQPMTNEALKEVTPQPYGPFTDLEHPFEASSVCLVNQAPRSYFRVGCGVTIQNVRCRSAGFLARLYGGDDFKPRINTDDRDQKR